MAQERRFPATENPEIWWGERLEMGRKSPPFNLGLRKGEPSAIRWPSREKGEAKRKFPQEWGKEAAHLAKKPVEELGAIKESAEFGRGLGMIMLKKWERGAKGEGLEQKTAAKGDGEGRRAGAVVRQRRERDGGVRGSSRRVEVGE